MSGPQPRGLPPDPDAGGTVTAFSRDGRLLASSYATDDQGSAGGVAIRSAKSLKTLARIELPVAVLDVAFEPRGHVIVAGSADGSVRWFDADSGAALPPSLQLDAQDRIGRVRFSPDGERLAISTGPNPNRGFPDPSRNGVVHMYDRERRHLGVIEPKAGGDVTDIAFSDDGKQLFAVVDQEAATFDVATRRR